MIRFVPRATEEAGGLTGYPKWMSRLLAARGVTNGAQAEAFLHPSMDALHDPLLLHDTDKAVALLSKIKEKNVQTVIYGDYDVDGVCATAILIEALSRFGIACGHYIPDRHEEGYGLNAAAVERLSETYGALITVDCGITSIDEIALAKSRGMTVILTDHHTPPQMLPPADAVVNPLLGDYPFPFLCGTGVAWKLAAALLGNAEEWLDLCALATIADMVPLTGENRVLAYYGLRALTDTKREGLKALKSVAAIEGDVTAEMAAFALAPRMNAVGRMESAESAEALLLTRDKAEADMLSRKLDQWNAERKRAEADVLAKAEEQIPLIDLTVRRAIVLCGEHWNSGVVGLAAGRIAEKYGYPTVVFTRENDTIVGSARSAGDVDIYEALKAQDDLYLRFGGHRQAAGLTMPYDRLEEFTDRLSNAVSAQLHGGAPVSTYAYDGDMRLSDFSLATVDALSQFAPFGIGNPTPRFLLRSLEALELRPVGAEGRHLRVAFMQENTLRNGVLFGGGDQAAPAGARYTVLAAPTRNEYRGRICAEMRVHALALEPESVSADDFDLLSAWLPDIGGGEAATPVDALPPLRAQGDLLLCRTKETLLSLIKAYPDADFVYREARDARAYTALALCLSSDALNTPYTRIFLCDGDFGEAEALRKSRPDAEIFALPRTNAARALLASAHTDKAALREIYKAARDGAAALTSIAERAHLTPSRALSALYILSDAHLIDFTATPFSLSVPPPQKTDPEQCARCRLLSAVKEEIYGEHGL